MVLVSIPVCFLFLSILVASSPYLTRSSSVIIWIYLLLRCILSDISGRLFSVVIMLSPLISRMVLYIFQLLGIIIIFFYNLFDTICHISNRCYILGGPQPSGFSQPSLNLSCSFTITRVSILLSVWMMLWSWFTLSRQVRGLTHFCVLYWFALDYILIFPSLIFTSHTFFGGGYLGILTLCPYLCLLISF